jgi:hypothetical protein
MDTQTDPANVQVIPHDGNGNEVDVYFGCWLDINQPQNQYPLNPTGDGPYSGGLKSILELVRNLHQCLLVEIAYDPVPIVGDPSPADSDKLAQRNLQLVESANPGTEFSRRIPSAFELKPTVEKLIDSAGVQELLIDWGNVPMGSTAQVYIPTVESSDIIALAGILYGNNLLSKVDEHTVQCSVGQMTYIPIPPGATINHTGLLTIDLPPQVRRGQLYKAVVRQLTNARGLRALPPIQISAQPGGSAPVNAINRLVEWRTVRGAFQVSIPVKTKSVMLAPEENALSILKWIELSVPQNDRWYPVFTRYVSQIGQRVLGLGGDPGKIHPSPIGQGGPPGKPPGPPSVTRVDSTGKVTGLFFDHFGDFRGFEMDTLQGNKRYESTERDFAALIERAWRERVRITVVSTTTEPKRPTEVIFRVAGLPY